MMLLLLCGEVEVPHAQVLLILFDIARMLALCLAQSGDGLRLLFGAMHADEVAPTLGGSFLHIALSLRGSVDGFFAFFSS